jgi:hypothetical protein
MSDHNHKSVTVLAVALLGFTVFQFTQILVDRDNIHKMQDQAKKSIEQADKVLADNQKMLDQLNAIAIGTQRLADAGNNNAKEIVTQLNRLGIKINPNFKPGQEGAPAQPDAGAAPAGQPPAPPAPPPAPPTK